MFHAEGVGYVCTPSGSHASQELQGAYKASTPLQVLSHEPDLAFCARLHEFLSVFRAV